jgi:hypothetical protein
MAKMTAMVASYEEKTMLISPVKKAELKTNRRSRSQPIR